MNNASNSPQSALVIGGTSEIALAIIDRLAAARLQHVILASRNEVDAAAVAQRLRAEHPSLKVGLASFEAANLETHATVIESATAELGDIDLVIIAVGALGTPDQGTGPLGEHASTIAVLNATFLAAISMLHLAANQLHRQGHGTLLVISSAAALRPRRTNPAYGAAKAGLDGFTLALADRLHGTGVRVQLLRPAFVATRMTNGLPTPPMSTTTTQVADDVVNGLRRGRAVIWSPRQAAVPAHIARLLPSSIMRRLPW